ncbi:uncharacterized protein LOC144499246 [Mustelus asterias]
MGPGSLWSIGILTWAVSYTFCVEIKHARLPNHKDHVCSTWGNNHFKTFDGDVYKFPGTCDYNFVSDCNPLYKDFSIQVKRTISKEHPMIHYVTTTIKDIVIYMTSKIVVVNGALVSLPYFGPGLYVEQTTHYTKLYGKFGLTLMWNREDALMVELDVKFQNKTCGLCGDYNGLPVYNEFIVDGQQFSPIHFGNLQKIHQPNERCEDVVEHETETNALCEQYREACENLLSKNAFADCKSRLNTEHYIQACMQDMCTCSKVFDSFCLCSTASEYSRQCSHAGGKPENWRTETFCPKKCPSTMIYKESGSPCMNSCSHLDTSSLCEEHYMDGCFCPPGMVLDDYSGTECISVKECKCAMNGKRYNPGALISAGCEECVCNGGKWLCKNLPCPGVCSFEGGAHVSTFDGMKYTHHGDCYYILSKDCDKQQYILLAEIVPCGTVPTETCLKTLVLTTDHKHNILIFKDDGNVLLNGLKVTLPLVTANYTVFKPSTFHILLETRFGLQLQVQIVPLMQVYITLEQSYKGKTCGFCGNFNDILHDDLLASNGIIEGTAASFANTWKAQQRCRVKSNRLENPCAISVENKNYAEYWCSLLKEPGGEFAPCHSTVQPNEYFVKCMYDSCNCDKNEDCMCAALYSYVRACANKGVMLTNWREKVCGSYIKTCPKTLVYSYDMKGCRRTCRSLSEKDITCGIQHVPVDGCGCAEGMYMNDKGRCVPSSECPCLYQGTILNPGETINQGDTHCVCQGGNVQCTTSLHRIQKCSPPKIYLSCNTTEPGSTGAECRRICGNQNLDCYSEKCVSGCVCPEGLLDNRNGSCVIEDKCPCMHNDFQHSPGSRITVDCNTCTCQKGSWDCTNIPCFGACTIYGSGHYITFDGKRYNFDGNCEYVAAQDYCGDNLTNGTFSLITENVPCGTTGTTCSKSIKLFFENFELKLAEGKHEVIQRNENKKVPFTIRSLGLYLALEANNGLILIWDKKTSVFIKLSPSYKGNICGLCGNFDGNANNDFMMRSQSVVTDVTQFGNSWKLTTNCPDAVPDDDPCTKKPHRRSWAQKQCSIITSDIFANCHQMVDPNPFYDACVHDSCSCDSGGDCECFCMAVASYAFACNETGRCIDWRTPEICPMYCSFYNPSPEMCEWHYYPCGFPCFKSCLNPLGLCNITFQLGGCYPKCPENAPIYDEHTKQCVSQCGCYDENGKHYEINETVEATNNSSTVIMTSTSTVSATSKTLSTTCVIVEECEWTKWISVSKPNAGYLGGDFETYDKIKEHGHAICDVPSNIECRAVHAPDVELEDLEQTVECNVSFGLKCENKEQYFNKQCYDYEIQVLCCDFICRPPASTTEQGNNLTTTFNSANINRNINCIHNSRQSSIFFHRHNKQHCAFQPSNKHNSTHNNYNSDNVNTNSNNHHNIILQHIHINKNPSNFDHNPIHNLNSISHTANIHSQTSYFNYHHIEDQHRVVKSHHNHNSIHNHKNTFNPYNINPKTNKHHQHIFYYFLHNNNNITNASIIYPNTTFTHISNHESNATILYNRQSSSSFHQHNKQHRAFKSSNKHDSTHDNYNHYNPNNINTNSNNHHNIILQHIHINKNPSNFDHNPIHNLNYISHTTTIYHSSIFNSIHTSKWAPEFNYHDNNYNPYSVNTNSNNHHNIILQHIHINKNPSNFDHNPIHNLNSISHIATIYHSSIFNSIHTSKWASEFNYHDNNYNPYSVNTNSNNHHNIILQHIHINKNPSNFDHNPIHNLNSISHTASAHQHQNSRNHNHNPIALDNNIPISSRIYHISTFNNIHNQTSYFNYHHIEDQHRVVKSHHNHNSIHNLKNTFNPYNINPKTNKHRQHTFYYFHNNNNITNASIIYPNVTFTHISNHKSTATILYNRQSSTFFHQHNKQHRAFKSSNKHDSTHDNYNYNPDNINTNSNNHHNIILQHIHINKNPSNFDHNPVHNLNSISHTTKFNSRNHHNIISVHKHHVNTNSNNHHNIILQHIHINKNPSNFDHNPINNLNSISHTAKAHQHQNSRNHNHNPIALDNNIPISSRIYHISTFNNIHNQTSYFNYHHIEDQHHVVKSHHNHNTIHNHENTFNPYNINPKTNKHRQHTFYYFHNNNNITNASIIYPNVTFTHISNHKSTATILYNRQSSTFFHQHNKQHRAFKSSNKHDSTHDNYNYNPDNINTNSNNHHNIILQHIHINKNPSNFDHNPVHNLNSISHTTKFNSRNHHNIISVHKHHPDSVNSNANNHQNIILQHIHINKDPSNFHHNPIHSLNFISCTPTVTTRNHHNIILQHIHDNKNPSNFDHNLINNLISISHIATIYHSSIFNSIHNWKWASEFNYHDNNYNPYSVNTNSNNHHNIILQHIHINKNPSNFDHNPIHNLNSISHIASAHQHQNSRNHNHNPIALDNNIPISSRIYHTSTFNNIHNQTSYFNYHHIEDQHHVVKSHHNHNSIHNLKNTFNPYNINPKTNKHRQHTFYYFHHNNNITNASIIYPNATFTHISNHESNATILYNRQSSSSFHQYNKQHRAFKSSNKHDSTHDNYNYNPDNINTNSNNHHNIILQHIHINKNPSNFDQNPIHNLNSNSHTAKFNSRNHHNIISVHKHHIDNQTSYFNYHHIEDQHHVVKSHHNHNTIHNHKNTFNPYNINPKTNKHHQHTFYYFHHNNNITNASIIYPNVTFTHISNHESNATILYNRQSSIFFHQHNKQHRAINSSNKHNSTHDNYNDYSPYSVNTNSNNHHNIILQHIHINRNPSNFHHNPIHNLNSISHTTMVNTRNHHIVSVHKIYHSSIFNSIHTSKWASEFNYHDNNYNPYSVNTNSNNHHNIILQHIHINKNPSNFDHNPIHSLNSISHIASAHQHQNSRNHNHNPIALDNNIPISSWIYHISTFNNIHNQTSYFNYHHIEDQHHVVKSHHNHNSIHNHKNTFNPYNINPKTNKHRQHTFYYFHNNNNITNASIIYPNTTFTHISNHKSNATILYNRQSSTFFHQHNKQHRAFKPSNKHNSTHDNYNPDDTNSNNHHNIILQHIHVNKNPSKIDHNPIHNYISHTATVNNRNKHNINSIYHSSIFNSIHTSKWASEFNYHDNNYNPSSVNTNSNNHHNIILQHIHINKDPSNFNHNPIHNLNSISHIASAHQHQNSRNHNHNPIALDNNIPICSRIYHISTFNSIHNQTSYFNYHHIEDQHRVVKSHHNHNTIHNLKNTFNPYNINPKTNKHRQHTFFYFHHNNNITNASIIYPNATFTHISNHKSNATILYNRQSSTFFHQHNKQHRAFKPSNKHNSTHDNYNYNPDNVNTNSNNHHNIILQHIHITKNPSNFDHNSIYNLNSISHTTTVNTRNQHNINSAHKHQNSRNHNHNPIALDNNIPISSRIYHNSTFDSIHNQTSYFNYHHIEDQHHVVKSHHNHNTIHNLKNTFNPYNINPKTNKHHQHTFYYFHHNNNITNASIIYPNTTFTHISNHESNATILYNRQSSTFFHQHNKQHRAFKPSNKHNSTHDNYNYNPDNINTNSNNHHNIILQHIHINKNPSNFHHNPIHKLNYISHTAKFNTRNHHNINSYNYRSHCSANPIYINKYYVYNYNQDAFNFFSADIYCLHNSFYCVSNHKLCLFYHRMFLHREWNSIFSRNSTRTELAASGDLCGISQSFVHKYVQEVMEALDLQAGQYISFNLVQAQQETWAGGLSAMTGMPKYNETWLLCECLMATCIENNTISITSVVCPIVEPIECVNGHQPVKVYDEDGCCYHYECDCYCNGWGGSHFVTFDGQYYTYEGNCTYILVEEMSARNNFGIYIDNHHCDAQDRLSCPSAIIVKFEKLDIEITSNSTTGIQHLVTVDGRIVSLPYSRDGVKLSSSGINVMLEIPKIKALVTFNGLAFAMKLPSEIFGSNVQGQCGTCNNVQSDDCMLPSGTPASSCTEMADYWQVKDSNKPNCNGPSSLPTSRPQVTINPQTTQKPCNSNSFCKVLTSKLFAECHDRVSPDHYYQACVHDECRMPSNSMGVCASLQTYATVCMSHGICIDWRNYTNGACSFNCPLNKVYKACETSEVEHTCTSSNSDLTGLNLSEGCFCPEGTILFSPDTDLCVNKCGCIGPDGLPKEFDERFKFNCQDCICDKITHRVICQPHNCPIFPTMPCEGEGFININVTISDDDCCTKTVCRCNSNLCSPTEAKCDLGFKVASKIPDGHCCPVYTCEPLGVCVNEGAEYYPGAIVPLSPCQSCTCSNKTDAITLLNTITCRKLECNKKCDQGFEYQEAIGKCCGKCVQTRCVIQMGDETVQLIMPGKTWPSPYNNCTVYGCIQINDSLISTSSKLICPDFHPEDCEPGTITTTEDGCCKTCQEKQSCKRTQMMVQIMHDGCKSIEKVEIAACEGMCGTYSMYSSEVNSMQHQCNCCQELKSHKRETVLICPDGNTVHYSYIYVDACDCIENDCQEPTNSPFNSTIHEAPRGKRSLDSSSESGDRHSLSSSKSEADLTSFNEAIESNKSKEDKEPRK